jgi:hypothetical protein
MIRPSTLSGLARDGLTCFHPFLLPRNQWWDILLKLKMRSSVRIVHVAGWYSVLHSQLGTLDAV